MMCRRCNSFEFIISLFQIPNVRNSISHIEKMVSILKKLSIMHSVLNDVEIISKEVVIISTNLLRMTSDLFEYLKLLRFKDTITEVERIERIYKYIKIVPM